MKKVIIIGAGISGATLANKLANAGFIVNIYEQRNELGGNCYDFFNKNKVLVHKYGPHIFHTSYEDVWKFVNKYGKFVVKKHYVKALFKEKHIDMPICFTSIKQIYDKKNAQLIISTLKKEYKEQKGVSIFELLKNKNKLVKEFANLIYLNFYKNYTEKQWGDKMENINPDILNRVKINLVDSSDYFPNDKYTGFCASGYADLVKKMLKHKNIKIHLHKKINSSILKNKDTIIVNTGMIDELFNFKYGKLSYRSVKFNFVTGKNNYKYTVLNTPADKKYTRFSNYGSFGIINKNTVLAKEYPMKYDGKNIPSYPITFNKSNLVKLDKYNALANKYKNLYMLGRLANFKYIDMDDSIFNAFALAKKIIELK